MIPETKFSTEEINPYGQMDDDYGDDQLNFQAFENNHQYVANLKVADPVNEDIIDQVVDLGSPYKMSLQNSDTTKSIRYDYQDKLYLSPSPTASPALQSLKSVTSDMRQFSVMEIQSSEVSYDSSQDFDSSTGKTRRKIKVPQAKRRSSDPVHNRGHGPAKEKKVKKYKKDQRKNMYGYSFKFIVKEFLSEQYRPFFDKLCLKFGVNNKAKVRDYYQEKLKWSISLKDLRSFLNFDEHLPGDSLRSVKETFHGFYVWYMRKRYTLHILTEDKIVHKEPYLEAKNYLIYLPKIKPKGKQRTSSSDR